MCGISGYVGKREAIPIVMEGIHWLEYRGYDSAGIAGILKGKLYTEKRVGKVNELEKVLTPHPDCHIAIAHTRWATHGKPSQENAHPHFDRQGHIAVVHNGIIENHDQVRRYLQDQGIKFASETDTEVIAKLIGFCYKGGLLEAVQAALANLQGAFAVAVIHKSHPDQMIAAAKESPLAIGIAEDGVYLSSDARSFMKYTRKVIYLQAAEVASITENSVQVYDATTQPIDKKIEELSHEADLAEKGEFSHFMHKEIHEQKQTIRNAFASRYSMEHGSAILDELTIPDSELKKVERIVILACGTSYHAGLLASYMLEEIARIPTDVEISSEYRYRNPIVRPNTLVVAISQSGETADTLAAMQELKEKGAKIVGICNVQGSTLSRKVDSCLFLRAGPEIGVASTKAFTSQVIVLFLFALKMARMRSCSVQKGQEYLEALTALPAQAELVLAQEKEIAALAHEYGKHDNFFFLGRRYMFPTALEGALKLKEIAYINANGYAAGEMKHGPIALIDESCPTVAFGADMLTLQKLEGNLREVKARHGKVLCIAPKDAMLIRDVSDDIIWVPPTIDELAPILSTIASQLFAYHAAASRGTEIDQPRNLAKSVTVE
ncbi:MAG: glutamine--fructose-6-phosphate transaminase (isomerizing) [Chlamydiales bacterium]|nr:glutamine--fructose-6-phosphate transaminase (isomerizing) [Chlamydiales bacterium]